MPTHTWLSLRTTEEEEEDEEERAAFQVHNLIAIFVLLIILASYEHERERTISKVRSLTLISCCMFC